MNVRTRFIPVAACLLVLMGLAAVETAQAQRIDRFGQFLVSRPGRVDEADRADNVVSNPTRRAMFFLAMYYDFDGSLRLSWGGQGCAAGILPAHATASLPPSGPRVERCFDVPDGVEGEQCEDTRPSYEIVAVPIGSNDPLRGVFDDNHPQLGITMLAGQGGGGKAVAPSNFHLPTGEDKAFLIDCACAQMIGFGVDNSALNELGVFCPLLP